MKPSLLRLVACFGVALLASHALAQTTAPTAAPTAAKTSELSTHGVLLDRIAAIVNEGIVLTSQLDSETANVVARLRAQNTQIPPLNVLRKQVLERLIVRELQL